MDGHTLNDWRTDMRTRLTQIQLVAKRTELKRLESRLDALITVDQRRALELKAIQDEMAAAQ